MEGSSFETLLLQVTGDIASRVGDRFRRYVIPGESHTVLPDSSFYTPQLNGLSMAEWLSAMVNNQDATWPDLVAAPSQGP